MTTSFKVGYNLKGDKNHHAAIVSDPGLTHEQARQQVLDHFKNQRITRALVLIDCIELSKTTPQDPKVV